MDSTDTTLRATLRLWLADGVGSITFRRLIEAFGSPEAVIDAGVSGLQRTQGVGPKTAEAVVAVTDADVDEELAAAAECGATILIDSSEDYPQALRNIYDPPPVLYVRGRLQAADALAVGIVGSRRCTQYGLEQAMRFGSLLGRAGFTVVSGGARGIDTGAHRGAIDAGGRTIAVMGCGLSSLYPPENRELFARIVTDGCGAVISELPMRTAVLAGNFPTRNRVISGLSLGVLVVEAARRSGSLITAREAAEQGREVFAVPGPADSLLSRGTNELIRDGAVLVQDLDDILGPLGSVGEAMQPATETVPVTPPNLSGAERTLHAMLTDRPMSLDELVRSSNLSSSEVTATMTMLVLKGAVAQQPGNVFAQKR